MRTVIAEDSTLFREGLSRLLIDADHEIVAKVGDADALIAAVRKTQPDLAIIDIHMPPHLGDDGAKAACVLRDDYPDLGIMLLSQHIETHNAVTLLTQGGFGYLLKDRVFDIDSFLDALDRVAAGGSALDPEVVAQLIGPKHQHDPMERLTAREHDVLALMAEGLTNRGLSRRLWLTERTIETHAANAIMKLGIVASEDDHRRVLAVLAYLSARGA